MQMIDGARLERMRTLNDSCRCTLQGCRVMLTAGVVAFDSERVARILLKVREFDVFDEANDPHGEHDFGAIDDAGQRIFWKIDYYDQNLIGGSEDPADPNKTIRVLTVMLAEEY